MRHDEWAVSDVLGSVLLVGITVASFAGLSLLVANIPPPPDNIHAELAISVKAGPDLSWATGDEMVVMRHLYGESIPEAGSWVNINVNGVTTRIEGSSLAFSGDTFDIGEIWAHQLVLSFNDKISVNVAVSRGTGTHIMTSTSAITGQTNCASDNDPPHAISNQVPSNLEALTGNTPVAITALLVDICSNVDKLNDPLLEYWFGKEPRTSIVMTPQGGDTWTTNVPAPTGGWGTRFNQEFHYQITSMQDDLGNIGNSPIRTDFIEPLPPSYHYVTNRTAILGDIQDFPKMQSATDSGATARLREALPSGATGTVTVHAQGLSTVAGNGNSLWDKPINAIGNNPQEAKYKHDSDPSLNYLRTVMVNPPPSSDQIIAVKIVVWAETGPNDLLANNDDGWRLQACWTGAIVTGSDCSQKSGVLTYIIPSEASDIVYDITGKRPGGGSWKWSDINNLDVLVNGQIVNGIRDGDWQVKTVRLEITHGPGFSMEHQFSWDSPILPTAGTLELNYYTNQGHFQVEVWDWALSKWNARTSKPLTAITPTAWSDPLTTNEWNTGDVKIRVVSLHTDVTKQAEVYFDYARLAT